MPTKKEKMKYWKLLALFCGAIVLAILAGFAIAAAAVLTVRTPKPIQETAALVNEQKAPSPFQNARFQKINDRMYWMTIGEDSYIYRQSSGPTSTITLVSRNSMRTTHSEKTPLGDVFVAETPFETAVRRGVDRLYFDKTTGDKIIEVGQSSSTIAIGSYDPVLLIQGEADCETSVSTTSIRIASGVLTGYRVMVPSWPMNKLSVRQALDAQDRVPVRCVAPDNSEVYLEPNDPKQPIFGQLQVSTTNHFGLLEFGKTLLRLDFTKLEAPNEFVSSGYYAATHRYGKYQVRVPIYVPYVLATEWGPEGEQAMGDVNDAILGFGTGPCWGGDCISLDILSVPSNLPMSGADFGKRSLALNRQYGVKDAVYSDETDTTFAGAPAFSFVATGAFEERGAVWGEKGYELDSSFGVHGSESGALSRPVRVIYFDRNGIFYRIMYGVGDTVAEQILSTWKFLKK
ncbi:hypothetical protein EPN90_01190 [Patescibacteria group bacterium]|nr:MAG: hypothetical protein EPN90_01190 [Patescibacteria group bacterium]